MRFSLGASMLTLILNGSDINYTSVMKMHPTKGAGLWSVVANFFVNKLNRYFYKKRIRAFLSKVFREFNCKVYYGPFKGMRYIKKSYSSALIPKILGTYERELHHVIEQIILTDYQNIVDIGCAEGYYAIGFAFTCKHRSDFHVYAYDTNKEALKKARKLSRLNLVADRITLAERCEHCDFEIFKDKKTLIFCDIEGDELSLLNPTKAHSLLRYDLLVEIHDGSDEVGLIKTQLTRRFKQTHRIQLIKFTSRTIQDAAAITCTNDTKLKQLAVNEGRKKGLQWMWMKRLD